MAVSFQSASSAAGDVAAAPPAPAPAPIMTKKECGNKCKVRCQKVQAHQDRCLNYCDDCCMLCKCVPSSQYDNNRLLQSRWSMRNRMDCWGISSRTLCRIAIGLSPLQHRMQWISDRFFNLEMKVFKGQW